MRLPKPQMWLSVAGVVSTQSTCQRLQVGCVITDQYGEQTWVGWNGNYKGGPNECDTEEPSKCGCIHAEANAAVKAPAGVKDKHVYCTHAPCVACAKLLLNSGISSFTYSSEYRSTEGVQLLDRAGINCIWISTPELSDIVDRIYHMEMGRNEEEHE